MLFPILHGESMVINYLLFIELLYHLLNVENKVRTTEYGKDRMINGQE